MFVFAFVFVFIFVFVKYLCLEGPVDGLAVEGIIEVVDVVGGAKLMSRLSD